MATEYDKAKRVVCPHCKGVGTTPLFPAQVVVCEVCGGQKLMHKVVLYKKVMP